MIVIHRTTPSHRGPILNADRCCNLGDITDADYALFATYQPSFLLPFDLSNRFVRTNIALRIRKAIDGREDYICLIERLYRTGLMRRTYYLKRTDQAAAQLQQHREALNRLGEIGRY